VRTRLSRTLPKRTSRRRAAHFIVRGPHGPQSPSPSPQPPVPSPQSLAPSPQSLAPTPRRPTCGFTLLEVVLALSLASLLLVVVGASVDFHLRLLDAGRTEVEEAQLARALLQRIADDLRSAVPYDPIDAEKLLEGVEGAAGELDELGAMAEEAGLEAGEEVEAAEDELANIADSSETPSVPGLYGNIYELRVDTSRLPRPDQYGGMLVETGGAPLVDVVSDVKTVAYYVEGNSIGRGAIGSDVPQGQAGLYRRESDRATTAYAAEHGLLANLENELLPIAPEVASIEFLYFDGSEVVEEWDSIERGGLPMAVEITLKIIPTRLRKTMGTASQFATQQQGTIFEEDLLTYRLLVHLPAAQPTFEQVTEETTEEDSGETTEETTDEPDEGGDSGSPSGGGPGGGGGSGGGGGGSGSGGSGGGGGRGR